MKQWLSILALQICMVGISQASEAPDSLGTLSIVSVPTGADAYIDSMYVGKTPVKAIALREASYQIKLSYPSVMAWNAITRSDTVRIAAGCKTEKVIELGSVGIIRSVPSEGTVLYEGAELGATPFYLRSSSRLSGEILIQKEGFEPQRVRLEEMEKTAFVAHLVPKQNSIGNLSSDVWLYDQQSVTQRAWPLYLSGSTMIASGVLSAYLKDQANRKFDRYLQLGDPAFLSSCRRLDRAAIITLAVSQVSFVILSYLLLSE